MRSFRSIRRFCTKGAQRTYSSEYYENVLGGVVTRDHFNAETNREETEIGNLGRLYIYQYHCCPYCSKVKVKLSFVFGGKNSEKKAFFCLLGPFKRKKKKLH